MEFDQEAARQIYRELLVMRGMTTKEVAEAVGVVPATIYNWLRVGNPTDLGIPTIGRIAKVLGVELEHMFYYNPPHEQAGAPPQAPEDWREQIREIERYVRSIEDPVERLATVRRLLSIARTDVEVYERSLERGADARAAAPGAAPAPGTTRGRFGRQVK